MTLLAIDPSLRNQGWAILKISQDPRIPPQLVASGLSHPPRSIPDKNRPKRKPRKLTWTQRAYAQTQNVLEILESHPSVTHVVIEQPVQAFLAAARNTSAIIKLSFLVGLVAGTLSPANQKRQLRVSLAPVNKWLGQCSKEITQRRVLRVFPKVPPQTNHNTMDAIGLGLWWARQDTSPRPLHRQNKS